MNKNLESVVQSNDEKFSAGNPNAPVTNLKTGGQVFNLWPTALLKFNIGRDLTFAEKTVLDINSHPIGNLSENKRSGDISILDRPVLKDIRSWIQSKLDEYRDTVFCPDKQISIYPTISWLTFSAADQPHHAHWHTNSILTGVFYMQTDNMQQDCLEILYSGVGFSGKSLIHIENTNNPTMWHCRKVRVPVETGDLLLFPSYVDHGVPSVMSREKYRISLAFNTWINGEIGSPELLNKLVL